MNIVIIGGGIAGVMSALFARKYHPQANITVVRSSRIGILGAGEGSTKEWLYYLKFLDIPINSSVFYFNTDATIKYGISFENWSHTDNWYYGFNELLLRCDNVGVDISEYSLTNNDILHYYISKNKDVTICLSYIEKLIHDKCKLGATLHADSVTLDPLLSEYGLHYDVSKTVNYLESIASGRGVQIIDGLYIDCEQNEVGDIVSVYYTKHDDVKLKLDCDYVLDCTGFARLIYGKHFQPEWYSSKSRLPVDRAVTYRMEHKSNKQHMRGSTIARARNHGWEWNIPTWHDKRCGYLYDSDSCSEQQAVDELEYWYGHDINIINRFKFEGGYFSTYWTNNCIAVGLAAGFAEPLEAATNDVICEQLANSIPHIVNDNVHMYRSRANNKILNDWEYYIDWLQMHYISDQSSTNTIFWDKFKIDNINTSPRVQEILQSTSQVYQDTQYNVPWWLVILSGNKSLKNNNFKRYQNTVAKHMDRYIESEIDYINKHCDMLPDYNVGMSMLRGEVELHV